MEEGFWCLTEGNHSVFPRRIRLTKPKFYVSIGCYEQQSVRNRTKQIRIWLYQVRLENALVSKIHIFDHFTIFYWSSDHNNVLRKPNCSKQYKTFSYFCMHFLIWKLALKNPFSTQYILMNLMYYVADSSGSFSYNLTDIGTHFLSHKTRKISKKM